MAKRRQQVTRTVRGQRPHVCAGCGTRQGPFEVDHIVPLGAGGADEVRNCQLLCRACHRVKTAHDAATIAKVRRQAKKLGVLRLPPGEARRRVRQAEHARRPLWNRQWKRKLNGQTVRRDAESDR